MYVPMAIRSLFLLNANLPLDVFVIQNNCQILANRRGCFVWYHLISAKMSLHSYKTDSKNDSGVTLQSANSSSPAEVCVTNKRTTGNTGTGNNKTSNGSHASTVKKSGSRNRSSHCKSKRNVQTSNHANKRSDIIDDSPDIMTIIKSSKKGMDISHLINYKYAPDDNCEETYNSRNNHSRRQQKNNNNRKKYSPSEIRLSGMGYINANYKFILGCEGDFKPQLLDPNLPLDTKDIVRVVVKQHDYHCPICMGDEFVAPRMTKCGHIFCYPCLINMFDNVKHDKKKTNLGNMHNPSISCPLCSEVIKEKFALLPVLVEQVKETESKINVKTYTNVSLMHRAHSRIYSQPVSNFYLAKGFKNAIPWISKGCTPLNYKQRSPYTWNSRLMKCDLNFVVSCYQKEIDDLMTQKLLDFEIYGDSGEYFDMAIETIQKNIDMVETSMKTAEKVVHGPEPVDQLLLEPQFSELSLYGANNINLPSFKDGFYYYQCDINSRIHYFLSPLDVQVINGMFNIPSNIEELQTDKRIDNPAYNLPLSLNVYIENINFDEDRITPELVSRYPYLGYLPYGAEIGYLEIDWTKFDGSSNPIDNVDENNREKTLFTKYPTQIPPDLRKKLQSRTRNINKKRVHEENARVRGELRREKETLRIYSKESDYHDEDEEENLQMIMNASNWNKNQSAHIDTIDDVPVLKGVSNSHAVLNNFQNDAQFENVQDNRKSTGGSTTSAPPPMTTQTSVWGTKVPVVVDPEEEAQRAEEAREFEEMIRKVKDEALASDSAKGKKGKKGRRVKMVPLPL